MERDRDSDHDRRREHTDDPDRDDPDRDDHFTISDKARAELDRIQEENNMAAQEGQKFYWR